MKHVTVTFTGEQARILLNMIRNDTEALRHDKWTKSIISQNDRMEARLLKAIMKAEGKI